MLYDNKNIKKSQLLSGHLNILGHEFAFSLAAIFSSADHPLWHISQGETEVNSN